MIFGRQVFPQVQENNRLDLNAWTAFTTPNGGGLPGAELARNRQQYETSDQCKSHRRPDRSKSGATEMPFHPTRASRARGGVQVAALLASHLRVPDLVLKLSDGSIRGRDSIW